MTRGRTYPTKRSTGRRGSRTDGCLGMPTVRGARREAHGTRGPRQSPGSSRGARIRDTPFVLDRVHCLPGHVEVSELDQWMDDLFSLLDTGLKVL